MKKDSKTEINELYYYQMVNHAEEGKTVIEYINPLVPQMYDHNFWYLKTHQLTPEVLAIMDDRMGQQDFMKIYGKISSSQEKANWQWLPIPGYQEVPQHLVYTMLEDTQTVSALSECEAVRAVDTAEAFQRFLNFNYEDGLNISPSFAKEKTELLRHLYQKEDVRFYTAMIDGQVVGCLEVYRLPDYYKIESVYVDEAFRKRGLASGMIRSAVCETLKKEPQAAFSLATEVEGMALPLYKKLGFTEVAYATNHLFLRQEQDSPK